MLRALPQRLLCRRASDGRRGIAQVLLRQDGRLQVHGWSCKFTSFIPIQRPKILCVPQMMGPKVACDRECGPEGAGFNCGGGADEGDLPPALSLYCIKGKLLFTNLVNVVMSLVILICLGRFTLTQ